MTPVRWFRSLLFLGLTIALGRPNDARATSVVLPGWDLLQTDPSTTAFMGVPWEGVPLGSFDFGGSVGSHPVGVTDTILRRLAPASGPSTTIPIELVALGLQSVMPVDLGLGLHFHFLTLQSARGGPASVGEMTIDIGPEGVPHGQFDSFFDVFFDIRIGALDGPIVQSEMLRLSSTGTPWQHDPVAGAVTIDGVNHLLNGIDTGNDFWPMLPILEQNPRGQHGVHPTLGVPDGGPGALISAAAVLLLLTLDRRGRRVLAG